MKTVIHPSTGAPNEAVAGFPTTYAVKGFRVIPLLAAGATLADLVAVYGNLTARTTRNSQALYASGVAPLATETNSVVGPDWHRSPGFNALELTAPAGNYLVQWADDCLEMVNVLPPYLNGFTGAGSPPAATPAESFLPQTVASLLNIPAAAGDGILLPTGCKGAYAVASADVGQTVNSGDLVWWRRPVGIGRWAETPAQDNLTALGRREQQGGEKVINGSIGDRIYVEARNVVVSAGALNIYVVAY